MDIAIRALTPALSADYFDFFENRAFTDDSPYRCYCQIYQMTKEQQAAAYGNLEGVDYGRLSREMAERQIDAGILRGYLAFCGDIAIGWCNANDKSSFTVLSRDIEELRAPAGKREKAVVCFEIAPEFRGKGVATALLRRVMEDARDEGYAAVEGYPDVRTERYEWDCKGPLRLYEKAGFVKVAEHEKYVVMRKELG